MKDRGPGSCTLLLSSAGDVDRSGRRQAAGATSGVERSGCRGGAGRGRRHRAGLGAPGVERPHGRAGPGVPGVERRTGDGCRLG
jgi:hypothetical protein